MAQLLRSWKSNWSLTNRLVQSFRLPNHELLIAKLNAYGFEVNATRLIYSYLTGRKQRVKINQAYSSWKDIIYGVPQGSILGPLLFNIYLCDLFLFTEDLDIANYADDTTPYHCSDNTESVIEMLEIAATKLFQWFKDNNLKANADKFQLLLSTNESEQININDTIIHSSNAEKLLGILIDNKLNFDKHVSSLCVKAGQKLHALSRISSFMYIIKRKLIMNAFITSQFGYCPLVVYYLTIRLLSTCVDVSQPRNEQSH